MNIILLAPVQSVAAEPVEVRVEGLEGDPLKNVQTSLNLPPGLIRDGGVDRLWLEHFSRHAERRVKDALEPFGFYGSIVSSSLQGDDKGGYLLLVRVNPGEPTRLVDVKILLEGTGAEETLLLEKRDAFPLREGEPLLHELYESAKNDMLAAARELGYLDADFSLHEVIVDPATFSARIHLTLTSGARYLFGESTIEGATYYPVDLLRRYITFSPGETFSYKAMGETQRNFVGSTYFKSVSVLPDKEAAIESKVPVVVHVVPSPRRTIRPGVGYGTDTGFRGSLSYRDLSLFYPGNTLNTELTVAEVLQGIAIDYSIPSPRNLDTVSNIQLNIQREYLNDTKSDLAALEFGRSRGFGDKLLGTAFIRAQYEEYTAGLEDSTSLLLLPGLRFSQHSYDDMIRPTLAYHYQLETRGTHRTLGSDVSFIQFIAEGGGVMPLPWRLTLKGMGKAGATLLDDPFADIPTSLRFFAGGDYSVRGYAYKSLGPKDASGKVIGGRYLLQGSAELERALFDKWGLSLFYDAGNAFDAPSDMIIYQGAGLALHYYTPIGSVNLGLARQIGVTDPKFRVHFSIGFQL